MVKVVLPPIPIYPVLALDLPKWVLKAFDKRSGFLWKGQDNANGASLQYGGLGIFNLELFEWALCIRWLWLQKTDTFCPWAGLPIRVPPNVQALFDIAVVTLVGDGESTKFWTDCWLQGKTIVELAPDLFLLIPRRARKQRTVAQDLQNCSWVADVRGGLVSASASLFTALEPHRQFGAPT
ncbi:hypothetical protein U9M48_036467 [Paspalum notatum var. saurae]|uniref:Uncharacterized protein n=1 Tax=Paspalum notatum var. saurae TaxID=547442 RepID=A0AAQ3UHK3_PASNO